jgi:hypothetical protein
VPALQKTPQSAIKTEADGHDDYELHPETILTPNLLLKQERMRELLQEERRNFEGELRSLGLSIADADRSYKVG